MYPVAPRTKMVGMMENQGKVEPTNSSYQLYNSKSVDDKDSALSDAIGPIRFFLEL